MHPNEQRFYRIIKILGVPGRWRKTCVMRSGTRQILHSTDHERFRDFPHAAHFCLVSLNQAYFPLASSAGIYAFSGSTFGGVVLRLHSHIRAGFC